VTLSGAQEVPVVTTAATGNGWVVISTDGSTITYYVAYSGLSGAAAAAHIHLGAAGTNGGVLLPLTATASPMLGTLTVTNLTPTGSVTDFAGAVAAIAAGSTYVNIHTAANPGGEIRGQIGGLPAPAPAPTANPTTPPTSTALPPAEAPGSDAWLVLIGLGVAIAAFYLPRLRREVRERATGGARPDRR
jgi:hypothetical protein